MANASDSPIDQSALTGESLPAEKHVSDFVYASSIVRQGEMNAFVVGTGANSYSGRSTRVEPFL
jgi:H+-transporting ATPase